MDDENPTLNLRTGRSVWELGKQDRSTPSFGQCPHKTDVLIVGAGITGSFLAERLTRLGRSVTVLDRHRPHTASTSASTALLQWEIDKPLLELEARLGFDAAAFIYQRSFSTVNSIASLVRSLQMQTRFEPRETLYLSGNKLDAKALREEFCLRRKAGLTGKWLDRDEILARFGIDRPAAILSPGSAEADPIRLAKALLETAIGRGANVFYPVMVKDYDYSTTKAHIRTNGGFEIEAEIVILANGYEMPSFVPSTRHRLASTWALSTSPQLPTNLWSDHALIWEASDPYFYLRTTLDHRIIIGGEDEDITDETERDAKINPKVAVLLKKLSEFAPGAHLKVDAAWAGFFGQTDDGLPLIGEIPGVPRYYAAFGYGGNGITFSALAADLIAGLLEGIRDPICDLFAVAR